MVSLDGVDAALPPDLDLTLRDAVVQDGEVERRRLEVVRRRLREGVHLLDADVPVGIVEREIAQLQVRHLLHWRKPVDLFRRSPQRDRATRALTGFCICQLDGD
jgi:hypothetical protein